jgi:hypothetical protein
MSTFNYAKTKATVERMLAKYGQAITLTHHSLGAYDPATGTATDTTSTQAAKGAIFEWGQQGSTPSFGKSMIPSSSIVAGDKQLFLSPTNITVPEVNDNITDVNGVMYLIKMVKTLAPAGTVVLIECNISIG